MKKNSKWKSPHTGINKYLKSQFSSQNLTLNGFNHSLWSCTEQHVARNEMDSQSTFSIPTLAKITVRKHFKNSHPTCCFVNNQNVGVGGDEKRSGGINLPHSLFWVSKCFFQVWQVRIVCCRRGYYFHQARIDLRRKPVNRNMLYVTWEILSCVVPAGFLMEQLLN